MVRRDPFGENSGKETSSSSLYDKSSVCIVGTWKIFFGNSPFKQELEKFKDVKFLKSSKKFGIGAEKLLRDKWINERDWRFRKEESKGPDRLQFDKLNTLKFGSEDDKAWHHSLPCADIDTPSRWSSISFERLWMSTFKLGFSSFSGE
jgi:hypothetical protein